MLMSYNNIMFSYCIYTLYNRSYENINVIKLLTYKQLAYLMIYLYRMEKFDYFSKCITFMKNIQLN